MDDKQTDGGAPRQNDEGGLLAELAQMAVSAVPEYVFLQELLKRAMLGLRAEAGAIWMLDTERRLVLAHESGMEQTGFLRDPALQAACEKPFADTFRTGGIVWHQLEEDRAGTKIRRGMMLGALNRAGQIVGLVQVFEPPWVGEEDRQQRMQTLANLTGMAHQYWANNPNASSQGAPQISQTLISSVAGDAGDGSPSRVQASRPTAPPVGALPATPGLSALAQASEPAVPPAQSPEDEKWIITLYGRRKSKEVALVAANECRRLLEADRVSVGELFGKRVKIQAMSGQQSVSSRSNAVRLLTTLAEQVAATGEKLTFSGDSRQFPPQFESLLADYLLECRSRIIIMQPVFGPKSVEDESSEKSEVEVHREKPHPVGILVVEQISETALPADVDKRLDRMSTHVGLALANSQASERIFLLPVWSFLGNLKSKLRGKGMWKVAAAVAALFVVALALMFIPWEYRVTAKGRLLPVERRRVFAPMNAEVAELLVTSGQTVHAGDLLIRLRNEELATNLHKQESDEQSKKQQLAAVTAQLSDRSTALDRQNEIELRGKKAQLEVEIEGAKKQVESLKREFEKLDVRSPIDGKVATFRIEELLLRRPVKVGDMLLEVMDETRSWRLEVEVPENRLGHILQSQRETGADSLKVKYMLATDTEKDYYGKLETLSNRSISSENEGVVIPAYVDLDQPAPNAPAIGAEVTAKIYCGKRSLGYVWFGDVIEAARKYLWL